MTKDLNMQKQNGFLMMAAVAIIVIFALLSAGLVSMFLRSAGGTPDIEAIPKVEALAESGLEQGKTNITQVIFANRQTCAGLSGTSTLSTGTTYPQCSQSPGNSINPRDAYATLSTAIANNTTPTTVIVNDTSVLAPHGRVLIGREIFQYGHITDSTTLGDISRAQDNTTATTHVVGEVVSQYQCMLAGIGNSTVASVTASREYQIGVQQPEVFAVGGNGSVSLWNNALSEMTWNTVQTNTGGITTAFQALSLLNYHSGWAVAQHTSSAFMLARLIGSTWNGVQLAISGCNPVDLYGVYTTSESEAFAVADKDNATTNKKNPTILYWTRNNNNDNTNWVCLSDTAFNLSTKIKNVAKTLKAIKMIDLNADGFAETGFAGGGAIDQSNPHARKNGVILLYSNGVWTDLSVDNSVKEIFALDFPANGTSMPQEAYFIAQSADSTADSQFLRYRYASGTYTNTNLLTISNKTLNGISVIDTNGDGFADFGCIVGNAGFVMFFYSDLSYTTTTITSNDLMAVKVISTNNIWAVGTNGSRYHYDGTQWLAYNDTALTNYNAVNIILAENSPFSLWYDQIN